MEDSTKELSKMLGIENAETAVHLYLYARYVAHYIYKMGKPVGVVQKLPPEEIPPEIEEMIEVLANRVSREVLSPETSTYHGKILPLGLAEDLIRVEEDVELTNLEKVVPYRIARDIVMVNPQKIAVLDCACRLLQESPCEPLDVCLVVGDPMASFMVEHNVQGARWITSDEAARILRAEHERGHVHTAYFKDVTAGRFYAICNCCSCCCLGMQAWTKFKVPIVAHSGFTAKVNDECTGCGDCVDMCPFDAIDMDDVAVVDEEKCMGCGVCEGACEFDAITLEPDPARGEPLDIKKLISEQSE